MPLVPVLFLTQALNAVLLVRLMIFMARLARDAELMGRHRSGHVMAAVHAVVIAGVAAAVLGLLVLELG